MNMSRAMSPRSTRLVRILLQVVALLAAFSFLAYSVRWSNRVTHGFALYYTYSRTVLEGLHFPTVYDYESFNSRIQEFGMEGTRDMPNNLPTAALTFLAIAWLPPAIAKAVWVALSLLLLAAAVRILFTIYGIQPHTTLGLVLIILLCLWRPNYDTIALGQLYFLLLFLFTVSVKGIRNQNTKATAFPIAAALLSKGYGVVPLLWMTIHRCRRAAITVAISITSVILITLPVFGIASWTAFFETAMTELGNNPKSGHAAFQTIHSWVLHMFLFDPEWLPHPVAVLPVRIVMLISIIANTLLVLYIVIRRSLLRDPENRALAFSAAIACSVVTAPLAEEYHFVLFLPLTLGLWGLLFRMERRPPVHGVVRTVVVLSSFVIAAPIPYKLLNDSTFPLILLAYPKLYGGLALLFSFGKISRVMQQN